MNAGHCERHDELLDALGHGFIGPELDAHLAACASCRELRLVAGALLDDRVNAIAESDVPSAGAMLWRIRMRSRREAEARARQSLFVGHVVTLAIAIALVVAFFGAELASAARNAIGPLTGTPFAVVVAMWLLLIAPIAGWVAMRQK